MKTYFAKSSSSNLHLKFGSLIERNRAVSHGLSRDQRQQLESNRIYNAGNDFDPVSAREGHKANRCEVIFQEI